MIELSSLLFKPVIERDTSNVVGRIKNAYFSQGCNCIAYFVISSCKQDCDALLPTDDVLCFSDAVIVQNSANVRCASDVDFTVFSSGVIGMDVYTQNGILKGQIKKVEFAKGGKVSKLYTETEQFTPQSVACVGDVILLKTAKQGKAKKTAIPRPENETKVFALNEKPSKTHASADIADKHSLSDTQQTDSQNHDSIATKSQFVPIAIASAPMAVAAQDDSLLFSSNALKMLDAPESYDDSRTPSRIISDYSFLIGRTLSNDLIAYSGSLIAKAGTTVDDSLVEKSRLAGKLVDLVLLAKRAE